MRYMCYIDGCTCVIVVLIYNVTVLYIVRLDVQEAGSPPSPRAPNRRRPSRTKVFFVFFLLFFLLSSLELSDTTIYEP